MYPLLMVLNVPPIWSLLQASLVLCDVLHWLPEPQQIQSTAFDCVLGTNGPTICTPVVEIVGRSNLCLGCMW